MSKIGKSRVDIELKHLRRWSQGRVTLLGDAAHAMTPNLGQGACQAMEDAVELGECLKDKTNIIAALKLHEKRRVTRANRIALVTHLIGQVVQWENPILSGVRNTIVRSIPVSMAIKRFMWLLDYQP